MSYVAVVLVLLGCGIAYVRFEQPKVWNTCLVDLKAPDVSADSDTNSAPVAPVAPVAPSAPAPPVVLTTPMIISPDSTNYINPDHVRPVDQPGGTPASTPATNGAGTNAPPVNAGAAGPTPTSIPSTITTLSGKTYTGCVLSGVTPDGIAFLDSTGGAKVLFTDLDPRYAATLGYDPVAAKKYEDEQAVEEAKVNAAQAAATIAASAAHSSSAPDSAAGPSDSTPPPKLTPEDRTAIQEQINTLTSDIAFMEREEAKVGNNDKQIYDVNVSHGAYHERILQERAQVAALESQLN